MIKESVSVDEVIKLLNEALQLDQIAMSRLCANRVKCNEYFAKHKTIQVGIVAKSKPIEYEVGLLGILNGLFGIRDDDGWGAIVAVLEQNSEGDTRYVPVDIGVDVPFILKFERTPEKGKRIHA